MIAAGEDFIAECEFYLEPTVSCARGERDLIHARDECVAESLARCLAKASVSPWSLSLRRSHFYNPCSPATARQTPARMRSVATLLPPSLPVGRSRQKGEGREKFVDGNGQTCNRTFIRACVAKPNAFRR